jgi:hypothetical protein
MPAGMRVSYEHAGSDYHRESHLDETRWLLLLGASQHNRESPRRPCPVHAHACCACMLKQHGDRDGSWPACT